MATPYQKCRDKVQETAGGKAMRKIWNWETPTTQLGKMRESQTKKYLKINKQVLYWKELRLGKDINLMVKLQ